MTFWDDGTVKMREYNELKGIIREYCKNSTCRGQCIRCLIKHYPEALKDIRIKLFYNRFLTDSEIFILQFHYPNLIKEYRSKT